MLTQACNTTMVWALYKGDWHELETYERPFTIREAQKRIAHELKTRQIDSCKVTIRRRACGITVTD